MRFQSVELLIAARDDYLNPNIPARNLNFWRGMTTSKGAWINARARGRQQDFMLKAALESLKRRADTQRTETAVTQQNTNNANNSTHCQTQVTNINNTAEPLSSQLSALLFSSSPPMPPAKTAKTTQISDTKTANEFELLMMDEDEDLDDLLKELDNEDGEVERHVDTLAYCTDKPGNSVVYSAVDSVYETRKTDMMLPMIDISTPQLFSQSAKVQVNTSIKEDYHMQSSIKEANNLYMDNSLDSNAFSDLSFQQNTQFKNKRKLLIAETFNIEDLKNNLKQIDAALHLNPIEAIRASTERRVTFPLGLMLRDFRQIGAMGQLRLLDGAGNEIIGTIPFAACLELKIKLHFGLILVLTNVSVFSPVPGIKYLNITKGNIQGFHYNVASIEE